MAKNHVEFGGLNDSMKLTKLYHQKVTNFQSIFSVVKLRIKICWNIPMQGKLRPHCKSAAICDGFL